MLRENVATHEKYFLTKMGLKFKNPKFSILSKLVLYFLQKNEPFKVKKSKRSFWNKQKWLNEIFAPILNYTQN